MAVTHPTHQTGTTVKAGGFSHRTIAHFLAISFLLAGGTAILSHFTNHETTTENTMSYEDCVTVNPDAQYSNGVCTIRLSGGGYATLSPVAR